nr:hypothetical protein [Tanacetum cinerariifolium]
MVHHRKALLAAAVYYVWQKRNYRIFKNESRDEDVLTRLIFDDVRSRLMFLKTKKSMVVNNVEREWEIVSIRPHNATVPRTLEYFWCDCTLWITIVTQYWPREESNGSWPERTIYAKGNRECIKDGPSWSPQYTVTGARKIIMSGFRRDYYNHVLEQLMSCKLKSIDFRFLHMLMFRSKQQNNYSKPMPWIGIYIALASVACILDMVVDLLHGLRHRKLWFPCKYFTLNAASLTVIAVAIKIPMDLNNPMPGLVDQAAKLGSMAFMCTMMANLLPSLATMDSKELLANIIALDILVITLIVNVCIQMRTRIFSTDYSLIVASIYVVMQLMLLSIHTCSALTILKSKQHLESKYKTGRQTALKDLELQQPTGRLTVEKLKQHFIGAILGTIAPLSRCFATLSFKMSTKWILNHIKVFKVESYWTQILSDWKQSSVLFPSSSRKFKIVIHDLKSQILTVAIKIPMDLNNPMPGLVDQAAKLGSMAFMCTMMANSLPSLATMDSKELLANIIALDILVITLIVNVCIQMSTRIFSNDYSLVPASIYVAMLLMLLSIHTCSALTILKSKQHLESKYKTGRQTALKDLELQQPTGRLTVEKLKQHFISACSATTSASGVICGASTALHIAIMLYVYPWMTDYLSDYKRSMLVILITQFIGAILGTIAPLWRCFATLSFKMSTKLILNHIKVFKVESYWTQILSDWKQSSVLFPSRSAKNPDQLEQKEDLSRYVLQLQDDMELAEKTLKGITKSVNRLIQKAEKRQPVNLLKLLQNSRGFEGVKKFDSCCVPPLLSVQRLDCWSLPVITLATIALSLPNIPNNTAEFEVYQKWLGNKLQKPSPLNTTGMILQWFKNTAKNMVNEVDNMDIRSVNDNAIYRSISANSMYRITESILLSYHTDIDDVSQEELFLELSSMISDILAACLTNIPQVIVMKCHTKVIEKREASVNAAAQLLGQATQIMNTLQDRELPTLHADEFPFIDKWISSLHFDKVLNEEVLVLGRWISSLHFDKVLNEEVLVLGRTRQRRDKVVSKAIDVQEVKATALASRDRYIEENNDEVAEQLRASFLWTYVILYLITRHRRYKVVSKAVDVQEVEATTLAGRDRYEVEGHQKHLKLAECHVEVRRLLTLYQACIHDFMFYGHSLIATICRHKFLLPETRSPREIAVENELRPETAILVVGICFYLSESEVCRKC